MSRSIDPSQNWSWDLLSVSGVFCQVWAHDEWRLIWVGYVNVLLLQSPPIPLGQEDCVTLYATSDTCNYFSTQVTFLHLLACTIFIVLQLHKHRTICVCCNIPPSVKHQEQCCVKCTWWLSCSWDCFVTPNRAWIHREAHETHWTQTNDEHFTLQHCQCWKYCLGVSYISQFMS